MAFLSAKENSREYRIDKAWLSGCLHCHMQRCFNKINCMYFIKSKGRNKERVGSMNRNLSDSMPVNDNSLGVEFVCEMHMNCISSSSPDRWSRKLAIDAHNNIF
jgi:hypothetical protein